MRNLIVRQDPDGNGNDLTYTMRINGAVTTMTVTMASTDTQASDLVNTEAVVQGDNIDVIITKNANIGNAPDNVTVQVEFA
jgi:hypothetical protein